MVEVENSDQDLKSDCPVIGILVQDWKRDETNSTWHVAAAYIKYIQNAGGQVVPIFLDQPDEYYDQLYLSINGFFIPGGGGIPTTTSSFGRVAARFMKRSREEAEDGKYFPIWGTCLGMEQMVLSMVSPDVEIDPNSPDYPLASCTGCVGTGTVLQKGPDWDKSYFIQSLSQDLVENILQRKICGFDNHALCIPVSVKSHQAFRDIRWPATGLDNNKSAPREFMAIFENVKLGWFAVQCHPEKAPFEFARSEIDHGEVANQFSSECASFFIKQARNNHNVLLDKSKLINNYKPTKVNSEHFHEAYLFKKTYLNQK